MIKKSFWLAIVLLGYWIIGLLGCGYTTRATLALVNYRTIYITPFANKVDITRETDVATKYKLYKPLLETDITRTVINKFLLDGNLRPIKKESADLTLKGELIEFIREPLRYSDNEEVEEYRIKLVVNLTLWDNKENKLMWEENNFAGITEYFTTGASAKPEATAINEAITDLAKRIVERAVEEW